MNPVDEKFVDVDGIRTRYFEKGNGENLVLIHGGVFGSNDAADCSLDWGLNFDALAQWFHVYALDKLGQGLTDNPRSDGDYTMAATIRHAIGFLEALGLGEVHLVGHSRGAYVAARMTLERPDLVKSCIPVDTNTLAPGMGGTRSSSPTPPSHGSPGKVSNGCSSATPTAAPTSPTTGWTATEIAHLPKYQETVEKMVAQGLRKSLFLTGTRFRRKKHWGGSGTAACKSPRCWCGATMIARPPWSRGSGCSSCSPCRSAAHGCTSSTRPATFSYREHPREFNEVLRGFIASQRR